MIRIMLLKIMLIQFAALKKENQLNIKLAIAEIKEKLNSNLSQEQLKHNKQIEDYQNKNKYK